MINRYTLGGWVIIVLLFSLLTTPNLNAFQITVSWGLIIFILYMNSEGLQDTMAFAIPFADHWDKRFFEIHSKMPKLTPKQIHETKVRLAKYTSVLNFTINGGADPNASPQEGRSRQFLLPRNKDWVIQSLEDKEHMGIYLPVHRDAKKEGELSRLFESVIRCTFTHGRYWFSIRNSKVAAETIRPYHEGLAEKIENTRFVKSWWKREKKRRMIGEGNAKDLSKQLSGLYKVLDNATPKGFKLYQHQKEAIAFIEACAGRCLVADDQGLGKTAVAIFYAKSIGVPTLVVCTANTKFATWAKEIPKWAPGDTVFVYSRGTSKKVRKQWKQRGVEIVDHIPLDRKTPDWFVINYENLKPNKIELMTLGLDFMVVDECQVLQNVDTNRTMASVDLAYVMKSGLLLLTGTPMRNRPQEMFPLLHMLYPMEYSSLHDFKMRYCDPVETKFGIKFEGVSNEEELNDRLKSIMLRRMKDDVLDLPGKKRIVKRIEMRKAARYHTNKRALLQQAKLRRINDLQVLSKLRIETARQKVIPTVQMVRKYLQNGKGPIILFHHHREVGDFLMDAFKDKRVARISGQTSDLTRAEIVEGFQSGEYDLLVASTLAANAGITLTAAKIAIFVEREWVPSDESQAEDRLYRIGQTEPVKIIYLSAIGSIDEIFEDVIKSKKNVIGAVVDGSKLQKTIAQSCMKKLREQND